VSPYSQERYNSPAVISGSRQERKKKYHQQGDYRTKLCTIRTKLCKFFHRQGDSSVRLCNFSKICFVGIGCPVAQSCAQNAQSCAMFIFVFISIGCYLSGN
jgi:hypothetical protein